MSTTRYTHKQQHREGTWMFFPPNFTSRKFENPECIPYFLVIWYLNTTHFLNFSPGAVVSTPSSCPSTRPTLCLNESKKLKFILESRVKTIIESNISGSIKTKLFYLWESTKLGGLCWRSSLDRFRWRRSDRLQRPSRRSSESTSVQLSRHFRWKSIVISVSMNTVIVYIE